MDIIYLVVGVIAGLGVFWMLRTKESKSAESDTQVSQEQKQETVLAENLQEIEPEIASETEADYSQSYQAKYLLTKNEWYEYKKLKRFANEKGLQVCPKVRLLDLVEPRKGAEHYKSLFYKIQAKHVDFLICDQDLHIKAVVELDDNSHKKTDRQERDRFVDQVLTSCGYKVIRTRAVTEETLNGIE